MAATRYHRVAGLPGQKERYAIDTRTDDKRRTDADHMKTLRMRIARLGNKLNPEWDDTTRRCELAQETFHELDPAVRTELIRAASSSPEVMLAITIGDWDAATEALLRMGLKVAVHLGAHRANGLEERQSAAAA